MASKIKTVDKYILKELLEPFLFGMAFFVTIWLIDLMMELINLIFAKGVPASVVGLFFIYSLPPTLVISFPMALLLANLVAFGRMSSDSEITALKAGGYSFARVVTPAILAGLFITLLTLLFNEKLVPTKNLRACSGVRSLSNALCRQSPRTGSSRPAPVASFLCANSAKRQKICLALSCMKVRHVVFRGLLRQNAPVSKAGFAISGMAGFLIFT